MTAFLKMHGLGNDFVVFDARRSGLALDAGAARALADRRLGIGCDQVIVVGNPAQGADAAMRILNADGGEVESCGNAARCVARLLLEERDVAAVRIETPGGLLLCSDAGGGHVTVDMGAPHLDWQEIPLARETDTSSFALDVDGGTLEVSAVSVGNPHCIIFVDDVESAPVAALGPRIEHHALFPARTNVEFAQVLAPERLRMRVWERGVGITRACGTGACATAVAAARRGIAARIAEIVLDGGALHIEWRASDDHILMTGPSSLSFAGHVDLAALERGL
jgi:diaminopimelate epimerase